MSYGKGKIFVRKIGELWPSSCGSDWSGTTEETTQHSQYTNRFETHPPRHLYHIISSVIFIRKCFCINY